MGRQVERMFSSIAPGYDRANHVLSFGWDRSWRRQAVRRAHLARGERVLDVACGTGDLSVALARIVGPGRVVGADFSRAMLQAAAAKDAVDAAEVHLVEADALRLPLTDASFDAATIGFGIRNVDDPAAALRELARVVRPGGRVVVLEFGQPPGPFGVLFRAYSRHVLPRLGGWLTGQRHAYDYLARTAQAFPAGPAFLGLMADAGVFHESRGWPLTGGVAWIYRGIVAPG